MTREETLEKAKMIVSGEREQQYGSPEDSFAVIAELWQSYIRASCVQDGAVVCVLPEDVAAMMALLKIARISTGQIKPDNWIDLAGYAACGSEIQTMGKRAHSNKAEAVEKHCIFQEGDCDNCPVQKAYERDAPCWHRTFVGMSDNELDRMLKLFEAAKKEN